MKHDEDALHVYAPTDAMDRSCYTDILRANASDHITHELGWPSVHDFAESLWDASGRDMCSYEQAVFATVEEAQQ